MLFRRVLIRILLLFAVAIFVRTTIACDGPKLQVTITSVAHTEVLIVEKSDNVIKWIIVTPQSGEIKGEIAAVRSSLEEEFNSIADMQTDDSQRQRLKRASAYKPTFVLLLSSETQRMTRPLTDQEHRVLADSDFMQAILMKLNERKALRKPQLLMDLFYPDRRDSISRRKGEFQYKEESSEDSPWEDDQETDQKDKNKGSGGPRAFNENE